MSFFTEAIAEGENLFERGNGARTHEILASATLGKDDVKKKNT